MTAARTLAKLVSLTTSGSADQSRAAVFLIRLAQSCIAVPFFFMVLGRFRTLIGLDLVLRIASTPGAKGGTIPALYGALR